ncbi:uncharacterized protein [Macrobrachium rosenbergii]|uniref:uncharacterized protein n=1 Tax=Macrobrachium rosenbergii TaxID=79674 RepID=UPI0034D52243
MANTRAQQNEDFKFYMSAGKDMGLSGQDLRAWVQERVDDAKAERAREREEREREREERERERIAQEQREERDRIAQEKREEREWEDRERQRAHELQMLERQPATPPPPAAGMSALSQAHSFMPKWTESEPEVWLERAERVLECCDLSLVLTKFLGGKALVAYHALPADDRGNWEAVRQAVTKAYEITPERWRRRWREQPREAGQTWSDWAYHSERALTKWLDSEGATNTAEVLERFKFEHFLRYAPPALATHIVEKAPPTLTECCRIADMWETHHPQEGSMGRKINPPSLLGGSNSNKNGNSGKPLTCHYCKKTGHSFEQCRNKKPAPLSPGKPTNNSPAPSTGAARKDFSQTFCTACKVYGHSPAWAKCPRNNKVNTPTVALAVTDPQSLGPPAEGPVYVAPPRGSEPARRVTAFEDSGAQISLIRRDRVPYGAIVNRRKLVTIEGINQFKMILPTVQLRVSRPHQSKMCNLAVASHLPGGYDVILGQDFQSLPKSRQSRGPYSPNHSAGASNSPPLLPQPRLSPPGYQEDVRSPPVPPEYDVQWPPRSVPDPLPVSGPASVPVPGPQSDLPSGDAKFLPVPLACPEQGQASSVLTDEPKKPLIAPDSALVPAPERYADLHSRDPTQDPLSSPGLAPLPASVRETVPPDHRGSSPAGAASQPVPELVNVTCEPLTPPPTASSLPQPVADTIASQDSAISHLADELQEPRRIMVEPARNTPASAVASAGPGGTPCRPPVAGPPLPRPRTTVPLRKTRGEITTGVGHSR